MNKSLLIGQVVGAGATLGVGALASAVAAQESVPEPVATPAPRLARIADAGDAGADASKE